jgi:DNA-binding CsgD family transcriptional regulator
MDLSGVVSCTDLAAVLDAAAGLSDNIPDEDRLTMLFVALAHLVGFDQARRMWVEAVGEVSLPTMASGLTTPVRVDLWGKRADRPAGEVLPRPPPVGERDHPLVRLLQPHLEVALRRATHPAPALTPREKQVLLLVRDGLGNAAIARALGVAESTVVKHLEHVYTRIGVHSRTQALRLCGSTLD